MKSSLAGFTLIELLLVIAIIAIVAAIALPGLLGARKGSNEQAAIGSLSAIRAGQQIFNTRGIVDVDQDGTGEYGFLQELCGVVVPRGRIDPLGHGEILPEQLGRTTNGVVRKSGYCFHLFLPSNDAAGGDAIPESDGAAAATVGDANAQEARWICYAWPISRGNSGDRAFAVNQTNAIYETNNNGAGQLYDGLNGGPQTGNEALEPGTTDMDGPFPSGGGPSGDGGIWVPAAG